MTLTSEEIAAKLREWQAQHKWANSTRNAALHELAGLFTYAVSRRWIAEHPTRGSLVARLDVDNARERWLRPHEIEALLASSPPWLQDLIEFAVKTTRRLGEILVLRRRNVEADVDGRAFLVTERTKNKRRVRIPLPAGLGELVKRKMAEAENEDARFTLHLLNGRLVQRLGVGDDAAGLRVGRHGCTDPCQGGNRYSRQTRRPLRVPPRSRFRPVYG